MPIDILAQIQEYVAARDAREEQLTTVNLAQSVAIESLTAQVEQLKADLAACKEDIPPPVDPPPVDPPTGTVKRNGTIAVLTWSPTGNKDAIRRNGVWLANATNPGTYTDTESPADSTYVVRSWTDGTRTDIPLIEESVADLPWFMPPEGKLWLGVNSNSGGYTSFKSVTGREPHIWHQYATSASGLLSDLNNCPAACIPLLNLKPLGRMGEQAYRDILSGKADAELTHAARHLKEFGREVMLAPIHEPENDAPAGIADMLYAQAFRYIVGFLHDAGVTNVAYVWNMMSYWKHTPRLDDLYPGDIFVDIIGYDPYCFDANAASFNDIFNEAGDGVSFYTWAKLKKKPMLICEWGLADKNGDTPVSSVVAPRIMNASAVAQSMIDMPEVIGHVYWNQAGSKADYRIPHFPDDFKRYSNSSQFVH